MINPKTALYTAPAKFDDGSAVPAGTISKYQLGIGTVTGVYPTVVDDVDMSADATGKQFTALPVLPFGNYFAVIRAITKDGAISPWSNELSYTVAARVPEAPGNFSLA